jgi:hypothetical protein
MALFSVIGDSFVAKILKQVAHDYHLDYEEMKARYCGKSSFEVSEPAKAPKPAKAKKMTVDLEPPAAAPAVAPEPPAAPVAAPAAAPMDELADLMGGLAVASPSPGVLPLSKMKKRDLELELERRGICPDGTIPELKERLKNARLAEKPAKPAKVPRAKKPKDPNAPKKERKVKEKTEVPAPKKVLSGPPKAAPKAPEPLEEEEEEDREEPEDAGVVRDFEDELGGDESESETDSLKERLRKILADAGEEEEEDYEDE